MCTVPQVFTNELREDVIRTEDGRRPLTPYHSGHGVMVCDHECAEEPCIAD
jgi:hypothetical protein